MRRECSCMGTNENCSRCDGSGYYDDMPVPMPPIRYAARTPRSSSATVSPVIMSTPPAASVAGTPSVGLSPPVKAAAPSASVLQLKPSPGSVASPTSAESLVSVGSLPTVLTDPTADPDELENRVSGLLRLGLTRPVGQSKPRSFTGGARTAYERHPDVKAWVLQEARGHCELCSSAASFMRSDGTPYLEHHHVRQLSEGGPDTVENSVALCANCHRRLHHGADREAQKARLYAQVARLVPCDEGSENRALAVVETSAAQPGAAPDGAPSLTSFGREHRG
jgi:hypothetical protein